MFRVYVIIAAAVAGFLTRLGLPESVIFTLITLSVSAFALTSLDSVARVGRLAFQELFTDDQNAGKPRRRSSPSSPTNTWRPPRP
jgi:carbon starvation protein